MDYTVQSGDTLFLIARRFGVTLDALIVANPGIRDPDLIYPGQVITVPVGGGQGGGEPGIPGQKPLNFYLLHWPAAERCKARLLSLQIQSLY